MAVKKTHTGTVITAAGEKTVQLHMSASSWVVKGTEYYYRESGKRGGAYPGSRNRLLLDSIKPLAERAD